MLNFATRLLFYNNCFIQSVSHNRKYCLFHPVRVSKYFIFIYFCCHMKLDSCHSAIVCHHIQNSGDATYHLLTVAFLMS
jgi:hypothetical protein